MQNKKLVQAATTTEAAWIEEAEGKEARRPGGDERRGGHGGRRAGPPDTEGRLQALRRGPVHGGGVQERGLPVDRHAGRGSGVPSGRVELQAIEGDGLVAVDDGLRLGGVGHGEDHVVGCSKGWETNQKKRRWW